MQQGDRGKTERNTDRCSQNKQADSQEGSEI
jgi:hypothetical protein